MFCANCGKEVNDKAVVCTHCGCAINGNNAVTGDKSFLAALLLCIFLGGFGAHRFYTGHTGTAILQLILCITVILCWVTAIWVIIDLIMIITGSFKTAKGETLAK